MIPGEKVNVLAQTYSTPFTVLYASLLRYKEISSAYPCRSSAKRFPGVIPTTELTRHFAKQGVRLPTRQKRTTAGDSDNEGEGDGGDDD